ncbi:MAG: glycosyltransferase family 39 protein [Terriglobales bacterium]
MANATPAASRGERWASDAPGTPSAAVLAWRWLLGIAVAVAAFHIATNGAFGFHRDELQVLDDARHIAWGFVAYPPFAPAIERVSMTLFGVSLRWLRLPAVLAQVGVLLFAAMAAAEFGGGKFAQVVTALAVAASPVPMFEAHEFQYTGFDLLWMTAMVYCLARLLRTNNPRWWLAIGAFAGMGLMTKYSMAFYLVALFIALLLTPARRYLRSRWLWYGLALAFILALPNLIWQAQHHWISLTFLRFIHARDIGEGRAAGFWFDQLRVDGPLLAFPLWMAGVIWLFLRGQRRWRVLGWVFVLLVAMLALAKGRGYYTAAVYPLALAAGAACWEGIVRRVPGRLWARLAQTLTIVLILADAALAARTILPLGPVSAKSYALAHDGDLREEVGWNELAREVARIRNQLPPAQRAHTAILTFNYGETGAIDMLGARYGLPPAISPVNSAWYRGYGNPPPQSEIILSLTAAQANANFAGCRVAGHDGNRYGIHNEEADEHPDIFLCGPLRYPWPAFWKAAQTKAFG